MNCGRWDAGGKAGPDRPFGYRKFSLCAVAALSAQDGYLLLEVAGPLLRHHVRQATLPQASRTKRSKMLLPWGEGGSSGPTSLKDFRSLEVVV